MPIKIKPKKSKGRTIIDKLTTHIVLQNNISKSDRINIEKFAKMTIYDFVM